MLQSGAGSTCPAAARIVNIGKSPNHTGTIRKESSMHLAAREPLALHYQSAIV
jgi:hypothetical protein